jgi:hypothetical protein
MDHLQVLKAPQGAQQAAQAQACDLAVGYVKLQDNQQLIQLQTGCQNPGAGHKERRRKFLGVLHLSEVLRVSRNSPDARVVHGVTPLQI